MNVNEFYNAVGGDYNDVLERLQNDAAIKKFLMMLNRDKNMEMLTEAIRTSDTEKAFRAAHTLKGIALNLSLSAFADVCSNMTEMLRNKDVMPKEAVEMYDDVNGQYSKIIDLLKELEA